MAMKVTRVAARWDIGSDGLPVVGAILGTVVEDYPDAGLALVQWDDGIAPPRGHPGVVGTMEARGDLVAQ